ncbi:hypothetical protein [Nostoc sp.]
MVWTKSISLDVANKLFDVIGVSFEQNELEGGYLAKHEDKTLIRPISGGLRSQLTSVALVHPDNVPADNAIS